MSEHKKLSGSDWVGIGLFALGSTGTVLMLLAMSTSGPVEDQGPFGPFAAAWKLTFGVFPSLFLNAAMAFLGARLFLGSGMPTLKRNLIGCAGLAVALAVVCGSWKLDAGGFIGARTGAVVSEYTHVALGTLIGLVAFFAVAWFAWFRAPIVAELDVDAPAAVKAVIEKPSAKTSLRPAVHKTIAANEGVSAAESAALFPDEMDEDEPVVVRALSADEAARASLAPFSQQEVPPSPYPEDVRRKGQIPTGAKPLESSNASAETARAVPPPPVYHWTAPHIEHADDAAGADLVGETGTAERAEIEARVEEPVAPEETTELKATRPATEVRFPLSPSWEREPAPFQPEAGDEEPVDAYGTPLTLVEQLRQARRESGFGEPVPMIEGDGAEDELDVAVSAQSVLPREVDAEDALVEDEAEEEIVEVVAAGFEEEEVLAADEDEEELVEDFEDEESKEEDADTIASEVVDEEIGDELPEEVLAEEELETEEWIPEAPAAPVRPPATPVRGAHASEQPTAVASARGARASEQQKGLFDPDQDSEPAAAERDVVLEPVAPAEKVDRSPKTKAVAQDADQSQLSEIGCLFIERGRVAVSMLQRQYEMDFDAACKVLDDLQEMGLIGPYLGGQRRDILLTREQWLERVSQAGATR